MSYTVLARKWRPKNFAELVGQSHVMQALSNALDQNRLHHAYLFTGTRGVGKTTIARIFSKALNCEQGISSKPCGICDTCRSIDEGRFIDLIEVDAASRTKVDDTREILDNVQFAPTQGRYKVYLIDEVHMLSKSSFNALLKTLEEPPEHVKFLLATTDPHKLPITVLSRCLQFNLMRLTQVQIQTHLEYLMSEEGFPFDSSALALIAKGADGSARDALSLLDQAIAYGAGEIRFEAVQTMLGLVDQQFGIAILSALAGNEPNQVKEVILQLATMGVDYQALLVQLVESLHGLSYYQVFGESSSSTGLPEDVLVLLASQISPERVQLLYQIALLAKQDLQLAPDIRIGFEMTLIRMLAFQPAMATDIQQGGGQSVEQVKPSVQKAVKSELTAPQDALAGLASARSLVGKKLAVVESNPVEVVTQPVAEPVVEELPISQAVQPSSTPSQVPSYQPSVQEQPVMEQASMENQAFAQQVNSGMAPTGFSEAPPMPEVPPYMDESQGASSADLSMPPWDMPEQTAQPSMAPVGQQPNSQPVPKISSSDHLAQIKARLKQPLGKLSGASPASQSVQQNSLTPSSPASTPADSGKPVDSAASMNRFEQQMQKMATETPVETHSVTTESTELSIQPSEPWATSAGLAEQGDTVAITTSEQSAPALNAAADSASLTIEAGLPSFEQGEGLIEKWIKIIAELPLKGMATDVARNSALLELTEDRMVLSVDPQQDYSRQEQVFEQVKEAVQRRFGRKFQVAFTASDEHFTPVKYEKQMAEYQQAQAIISIQEDTGVIALSEQLGLEVIAKSIKPI
ncbi:MAG: DNA polymerase III subunit gamma/tau [Thiomicrorhabdus sp.]|nr:MAG: DNA polymerase III subunit gamma/tau [Thiomicrorhabdus sp.]